MKKDNERLREMLKQIQKVKYEEYALLLRAGAALKDQLHTGEGSFRVISGEDQEPKL